MTPCTPVQKDKTQKASDTAAAAQGGADSRKAKELLTQAEGEQLKLKKLEETRAQVVAWRAEGCTVSVEEAVACIKDAVSEKLDAEQGAGVTDKDIYKCALLASLRVFSAPLRSLPNFFFLFLFFSCRVFVSAVQLSQPLVL